jgi:hypothetical protein
MDVVLLIAFLLGLGWIGYTYYKRPDWLKSKVRKLLRKDN